MVRLLVANGGVGTAVRPVDGQKEPAVGAHAQLVGTLPFALLLPLSLVLLLLVEVPAKRAKVK
jgi:hypothetical protein